MDKLLFITFELLARTWKILNYTLVTIPGNIGNSILLENMV